MTANQLELALKKTEAGNVIGQAEDRPRGLQFSGTPGGPEAGGNMPGIWIDYLISFTPHMEDVSGRALTASRAIAGIMRNGEGCRHVKTSIIRGRVYNAVWSPGMD